VTLLATSVRETVFDGVSFPGLAMLVGADDFGMLAFAGGGGVGLWASAFAIGSGGERLGRSVRIISPPLPVLVFDASGEF
jgi:hypothetical protein